MQDRKEKMISIFSDTQKFYTEDEILASAVEASKKSVKFYAADDYPELPDETDKICKVTVVNARTFEAATKYCCNYPDKKVAVLNFASATRPGGGVLGGSSAQEESLCRCSTLYPTLNQHYLWQKYYNVNRGRRNPRYTDACVYSPDIIICKSDDDYPDRLPREKWCKVDVITCAAPNLRRMFSDDENTKNNMRAISDAELFEIHIKRGRHIMTIACANGVNVLVLGAFGCGAFANNPNIVASAYQKLVEEFRNRFDCIEFAIYFQDYESENFEAFKNIIQTT